MLTSYLDLLWLSLNHVSSAIIQLKKGLPITKESQIWRYLFSNQSPLACSFEVAISLTSRISRNAVWTYRCGDISATFVDQTTFGHRLEGEPFAIGMLGGTIFKTIDLGQFLEWMKLVIKNVIFFKPKFNYSQTWANGHLWITASYLQRPPF